MSASNPHPYPEEFEIPFAALVEQSVVGIYIIQDERFVYSNRHWANIIGYEPTELIGMHLSELVPSYFLGEVLSRYRRRLERDPPSMHFITRGRHKLGHEVQIEVHGSHVMYRGRPAVAGVGIDATARLKNEAELREYSEMMNRLAGHTRAKLDEQRHQFSRDVHDLLGGMLTSIKMDATRILRRAEAPELTEMIEGLIVLTQQTIDSVRQIAANLREDDLHHLDLSSLIKRDLDDFMSRYGVAIRYECAPTPPGLSPRRASAVYRIFQEALTNIARHSGASEVTAQTRIEGQAFVLELSDNGKGFSAEPASPQHLGLLGMRERALDVSARLEILSTPGQGTRIQLHTPLI